MSASFYDLSARAGNGGDFPFSTLKGRVVLVVNTASKCGFTPQYEGLEALYEKYKDRGLVVLGFPCDQFAHQEPGSDAEIASFCKLNYGVSFPLMAKVEVNGRGEHPVYAFLKAKSRSLFGRAIKWNFTKFLVDREGGTVLRFPPAAEPASLERDIEKFLAS
jgi:glutathione peroxidase